MRFNKIYKIFLILIVSLSVSFFSCNRSTAKPGTKEVHDIALIYVGNDCDQSTCKVGRWNKDNFLPFLVKVNPDMSPVNNKQMFDTFLFLAISSGLNPKHTFIYDYMQYGIASTQKDWEWFLGRLFTDSSYQINALQNAAKSLDFNARVMVMIPYPDPEQKSFGNGWDFSRFEDRFSAVKWYIDKFIKMWNKNKHGNLKFVGFYWMEENIWPQVPEDEQLLPKIADYIHSLKIDGFKPEFTWISAQSYKIMEFWTREKAAKWRDYGFDYAFFQPNYYEGRYDRTINDLKDVMQFSRENGLGTEIEFDERVLSDEAYRQRLLDYFTVAEETGLANFPGIAYYQGVYTTYTLATKGDPLYDALMQFILRRK